MKFVSIFLVMILVVMSGARAGEEFESCTWDVSKIKAVPPEVFDSVKLPIKLGRLVSLWGMAYRSQYSGSGTMYWRCSDGRLAYAGPASDPEAILEDVKLSKGGNNWLAFNNEKGASEGYFPSIMIVGEQGAEGKR